MKRIMVVTFIALLATPSVADGVNRAFRIAPGAGVTGDRFIGPCAAGSIAGGNGASTDPSCQTVAGIIGAQTANRIYAGPTTGSTANPTFRALVGADLPNPGASSLGGVQSYASVSNQFLTQISTSGVVSSAQPSFTNISGTVACAQLPALTGDVTTSACAATIANAVVTNVKLATMATATIKANITGSTAAPVDVTYANLINAISLVASWNDTTTVIASQAKFWNPTYFGTPGATGLVDRFNRVFVGVAAAGSSDIPMGTTTWLQTYVPSINIQEVSQFISTSAMGGLGVSGVSRTSDLRTWLGIASQGSQGTNGFCVNDDTGAGNPICAAVFGQTFVRSGVTGLSVAGEFNISSNASVVDATPYSFTGGSSYGININTGSTGYTNNTSMAMVIGQSLTALFRKGIIFFSPGLDTTVGAGGGGVAIELPRGASYRWVNSGPGTDAEVWGDASGFVVNSNIVLKGSGTPASASAACAQGTFLWDSSFLYICIATNTWRRTAHATW